MTIEALAFFLLQFHFRPRTVDKQKLPITAARVEPSLAFDHYRKHFRLLIVGAL